MSINIEYLKKNGSAFITFICIGFSAMMESILLQKPFGIMSRYFTTGYVFNP